MRARTYAASESKHKANIVTPPAKTKLLTINRPNGNSFVMRRRLSSVHSSGKSVGGYAFTSATGLKAVKITMTIGKSTAAVTTKRPMVAATPAGVKRRRHRDVGT